MYTLRMSWRFRTLVLSTALVWALAPQLAACFLPETMMTESEADCCKHMAGCGEGNMESHGCCRQVLRSDVATTVKALRQVDPRVESSATLMTQALPPLLFAADGRVLFVGNVHAPPSDPQVSSLPLRI